MNSIKKTLRRGQWSVVAGLVILAFGCAMYTKGTPIQTGLPAKQALLVIDIQNDFVEPNAKLPVDTIQADTMIANINLMISAFSSMDAEIVYIGNEFSGSDTIANWFRNGAVIQGSPGAELSKRISVATDTYFPKAHSDAFSNSALDQYLRDKQITEVVLTGVFAGQCVLSTARGAIQRGFSVVTVSDALAAKNDKKLARAIQKHENVGARVSRTIDILAGVK